MENIDKHIQSDIDELNNPNISAQRRRHLQAELGDLAQWKQGHPNDEHDPTAFEMYCDQNPESDECRIYDV